MSYALEIDGTLNNLFGNVVSTAIKVVIFLLILALGWLVGRWIRKLLGAFLHKVGFDRAAERGGLHRMLGQRTASDLTAQLVMFAFLLFVLQLAFGIFGPNPVSDLISRVIAWLPRLFVAVVIVVVAAAIAGWVKDAISGVLGGLSYGRILATIAQVAVIVLGIFAALTQIDVAESVIAPVLWAFLAAIVGVLVVGLGGGLIKPMQHRWERMLNRVESETMAASDQVRNNRAPARTSGERDVNEPSEFGQPAYGRAMPSDTQPPTTVARTQPPADYEYESREARREE
jgi:MFS family permease